MKTNIIGADKVERKWLLVDAQDKVLGRVASEVAKLLRGKHKPAYTSSVDCGDYVVVINADKIVLTGVKAETKTYFRHSTYAGGAKITAFAAAKAKDPTFPLFHAVKGMLPKTALGDKLVKKLHVYAGDEHRHAAQNPQPVTL